MIYIPPTNLKKYVSSIVALNIHSPNDTGDWHSDIALQENAYPQDFYIYGENQKRNTHHLLSDIGIIDGTQRLLDMGYFPQNQPVWIADHPRACVDYLYTAVLQTGLLGRVILDDWFASDEDKHSVVILMNLMQEKLNASEQEVLKLWKKRIV